MQDPSCWFGSVLSSEFQVFGSGNSLPFSKRDGFHKFDLVDQSRAPYQQISKPDDIFR